MKKLLFGLSFVAIFVMVTTGAWATNGGIVKWSQRPDMVQGANIISIPIMPAENGVQEWATVADDWRCLDGSPVSDLHFWGSYPGWKEQNPEPPTARPPGVEAFRIQVYSDSTRTYPPESIG
ncbi:MAG: hypothetical protein JRF43_05080 [Deltaproteobacteria bacterium]|nr:hypothetical protein [Deltaproteobacteria bacterium]